MKNVPSADRLDSLAKHLGLYWWFSVGICKYKPGYKSTCYKFEWSHWLKLQHSDWRVNLLMDFFKE